MLATLTGRSRRVAPLLVATGISISLAGCGGMGDTLSRTFGFSRDAPDEFSVSTQAPLSMPPDYSIRPPRPGAPRPQAVPDSVAAEEALMPQTTLGSTAGGMSAGQEALVQEAGPPAPADIRTEIAQEQGRLNAAGGSFADRLMFWRSTPAPGIAVDPQKEAQRLRQNAALGQSPQQGQTPIIQPQPRGWLSGIF